MLHAPFGAIFAEVQPKDFWDVLDIISRVLIAVVGGIATYLYNRRRSAADAREHTRELGVMEVQTVATFLPHLQSGQPQEKEAALVAMSALGNTDLVTRLAAIYRDPASVGALSRIALSQDEPAAEAARKSLDAILHAAVLEVGDASNSPRGTGFIVGPGLVVTTDYIVDGLDGATVRTTRGDSHPAELIGTDVEHGVAALRVPVIGQTKLLLYAGDVDPRAVGELTLLGSTGSGWRTAIGRLEGSETDQPGVPAGVTFLRASLPTVPGHGGAPVVDRVGQVVAMHWAARPEEGAGKVALLLPAATIRAGLARLGVEPSANDSSFWGNPSSFS
jgi:S1-C subfamily serine protease